MVDKLIVLDSSCTVGDRSINVRDRASIGQIDLRFWPCGIVYDSVVILFCNFSTECQYSETMTIVIFDLIWF